MFVGRPVLWGLAWDGATGVQRVMEMLRDELTDSMAIAGCASVSNITRHMIRLTAAYYEPKSRL